MPAAIEVPAEVRSAFSIPHVELSFLGNHGGFSGAQLWRFQQNSEQRCVRRWPRSHPSSSLLQWQHAVLAAASQMGLGFIHPPILSHSNTTFVAAGDHLWQCEQWVPGRADYHQDPSDHRMIQAMTALARFHNGFQHQLASRCGSRSVQYKLDFLQRLETGLEQKLNDRASKSVSQQPDAELARLTKKILPKSRKCLSGFRELMRPFAKQANQPCLRDIWHDHVLFDGEELTGFVDFGALNYDLPENDLARLLGSLARGDAQQWAVGLQAYEQIRPLTEQTRRRIRLLNEANWLLGGLQWASWIWLEARSFPADQVTKRLGEIDYNVDKL